MSVDLTLTHLPRTRRALRTLALCLPLLAGLAGFTQAQAVPAPGGGMKTASAPAGNATGVPVSQPPAAPAPRTGDIPAPLQPWVNWAMQGHEMLACPVEQGSVQKRACIWPERLELNIEGRQAHFVQVVTVYGATAPVQLPGEAGSWPTAVRNRQGQTLTVTGPATAPQVWLPAGQHILSGTLQWPASPQRVRVPQQTGLLVIRADGQTIQPTLDSEQQVWLKERRTGVDREAMADTLGTLIRRQIDDAIPRRIITHYELNVGGLPREITLPATLLAGTVPQRLTSSLPARLYPDGRLQVQIRPGTWQLEVEALQMEPAQALKLPADAPEAEVWSYRSHNDLHVTQVEGVRAVDAQQAHVPAGWKSLPAYQVGRNDTFGLRTQTRGQQHPQASALKLQRTWWLDFDGQGLTQKDELQGTMSAPWRLKLQGPARLGHARSAYTALPIGILTGAAPAGSTDTPAPGIEVRQKELELTTLARLDTGTSLLGSIELPANGWNTVLGEVEASLQLPPGWTLMAASGVDHVSPATWTSRWRLYDFFFMLLISLAAFQLLKPLPASIVMLAALLSWYDHELACYLLIALLVLLACRRVAPAGSAAARWIHGASRAAAVLMLLVLLPFAVNEVRLMIYPVLEHHEAWNGERYASYAPERPTTRARMKAAQMRREAVDALDEGGLEDADTRPDAEDGTLAGSLAMSSAPALRSGKVAADDVARLLNDRDGMARLSRQRPIMTVQTGPGEPAWSWNRHTLLLQGDVQPGQTLSLQLLSPWGTRILKVVRLLALFGSLWMLVRALPGGLRPPRPNGSGEPRGGNVPHGSDAQQTARRSGRASQAPGTPGASGASGSSVASGASGTPTAGSPTAGRKASPASGLAALLLAGMLASFLTGTTPAQAAEEGYKAEELAAIREHLYPQPACLPDCAALTQMRVQADTQRLTLQLLTHAQTTLQVPLPAQDSADTWRLDSVQLDGQPATTRRDANGTLWAIIPSGIHTVQLQGALGEGTAVRLALPILPRLLLVSSHQWHAQGLNALGVPHDGVLTLTRLEERPAAPVRQTLAHVPDALPGFVHVTRTLVMEERWKVVTHIVRRSVSQAPVRVRFALLPGESVNDERVSLRDGVAEIQLGQALQMTLESSLPISPSFQWKALPSLNQTESWAMRFGPTWHLAWEGVPPTSFIQAGQLAPRWDPWPGETLRVQALQPTAIDGPTLTLESEQTTLTPGAQSTLAESTLHLRASLAGTQRAQLPADAQFLGMTLDGSDIALRADGQTLDLPILPGEHEMKLRWRQPVGADGIFNRFETQGLSLTLPGVNAATRLELPRSRVVLLAGGPAMGPAVRFWGLFFLLVAGALVFGRQREVPLGRIGWLLLLLGVAPVSLLGALIVAGWFFLLAWLAPAQRLRQLASTHDASGTIGPRGVLWLAGIWSFAVLAVLFVTIQTSLLGYPDLLVSGNGSSALQLNWYQDRFQNQPAPGWAISISLTAYRVMMLAWALWLAFSVLKWIRWGWQRLSGQGYLDSPPDDGGPGLPGGSGRVSEPGQARKPEQARDSEPMAQPRTAGHPNTAEASGGAAPSAPMERSANAQRAVGMQQPQVAEGGALQGYATASQQDAPRPAFAPQPPTQHHHSRQQRPVRQQGLFHGVMRVLKGLATIIGFLVLLGIVVVLLGLGSFLL